MDDLVVRRYFIYAMFLIFISLLLYFLLGYCFSEKAKKLSYNNININNGCLFFVKKYSDKNGFMDYEIIIDGEKTLLRHANISSFPFASKYYKFKNKLNENHGCYKISYIRVEFLKLERVYIYDLK